MRKPSKLATMALVLGAAVVGGAGAAYADAGQSIKYADGDIVFYVGTSGNARGNNFHASGSQAVCADGPTSALQTFVTHYQRNRTLQSDVTEKTLGRNYYQPYACSTSFTASSSNTYHLDITWSQASGTVPGRENGVTEH